MPPGPTKERPPAAVFGTMIDDRLMETMRRWRETGAPEDEAAYLRERMRRGELEPIWVALAAALDYPGAVAAGVDADHVSERSLAKRSAERALRAGARAEAAALAAGGTRRRVARKSLIERYAADSAPDPWLESLPAWARVLAHEAFPMTARAAMAVIAPALEAALAQRPRLPWLRIRRLTTALGRYVHAPSEARARAISSERISITRTARGATALPLTDAGDALVRLFARRWSDASIRELQHLIDCCARVGDGMPWALARLRDSLVPWALGYHDPLASTIADLIARSDSVRMP